MRKCEKCGKTDFDDADGCKDYATYSAAVGDWICTEGSKAVPVKFAWQSPQTAPKDRPILACFGFPWPVIAVFSDAQGEWVSAEIEQSLYQGKSDPSFVSEYFAEAELLGWLDLPDALMPAHLLPKLTPPSAAQ